MATKFLLVLYFRQVGDLPDIFQNENGRMTFSEMATSFIFNKIFFVKFNVGFFLLFIYKCISFINLEQISYFYAGWWMVPNFLVLQIS